MRPYKDANPIIWGGALGLGAAVIVWLTLATGGTPSGNPLLQNPFPAAGIGFFWGAVAANIKNWLGRRKP